MIQSKDNGSWNKKIPFSIVSTISQNEESKNRFKTRQKRGFETTQKMKCLRIFFWTVRKLSNLSYESMNAFSFSKRKRKKKEGLKSLIDLIFL